jgi:hypothetical protein
MEASDTAGQPPQEPGQTDATGQEQPATSQEQPNQDSNLTTPQPDQPVPSEGERQDAAPDPAQDSPPVQDQSTTSGAYKPEAERQGELDREREEHNQPHRRRAARGRPAHQRVGRPAGRGVANNSARKEVGEWNRAFSRARRRS